MKGFYRRAAMEAGPADLTVLDNAFVMQLPDGDLWKTQPEWRRKMFVGDVHGGTLVYRRELLDHLNAIVERRYPCQALVG